MDWQIVDKSRVEIAAGHLKLPFAASRFLSSMNFKNSLDTSIWVRGFMTSDSKWWTEFDLAPGFRHLAR
ncbi:hypothetical protein JOF48_000843 [Arthrobacter stackebrandtii]|uniref:Uncharacterized protein n=1 Tax=Arthrobacter stackebrandtii TaxID=272161 RepID=A0ABS4YTC1_9MICC|nr:hypothetical protein [Arthrobacter stackebrandtii]PYG98844.1 hypothetical protein CVV67_18410 [Arthrobacter stackebrandtii]